MHVTSHNGTSASHSPAHSCWLEIDLDAISANVRTLKRLVGERTAIAAVVKAEAYGLGAPAIARAALAGGAGWLAVARIEEAIQLRQGGIDAPILLLASLAPGQAEAVVRWRVTPTIADVETVRALAAAVPPGGRLAVHLKIDTGLTRFGAQPSELPAVLESLEQSANLALGGVYTHFAAADEADMSFSRLQLRRFQDTLRLLEERGHRPEIRHACNSAGTLALPEAWLDLVRVGITLAGYYPSAETPRRVPLRPAVSFKARLARVYTVAPGTTIGYNRTFTADRRLRVGLVPAGYADGVPRSHSNRAEVLVRGRRAPVVGRVSMDQCVIDLTTVPEAKVGDEVVLFGSQEGGCLPLEEYAGWSSTIVHEALCRIGPRVPRYYRSGGALRSVTWVGYADLNRAAAPFGHGEPFVAASRG